MFINLYNDDCMNIVPYLSATIDAIVTDPPYGCHNDCDYTRFTGGVHTKNKYHQIEGDDKPFDPQYWLKYNKVLFWGYQFLAQSLPVGTILVWNKRRENKLGKFLSDCELAWCKGGKGVYLFNHIWDGFDRQSERGKSLHPSQKPVALMKWSLEKLKLPVGSTILDPYMGTGCIGLACIEMKYNYIGIELVKEYFEIAQYRINKVMNENIL